MDVLIVSNDPNTEPHLRRAFSNAGYTVVDGATEPAEISRASQHCDIVVLDWDSHHRATNICKMLLREGHTVPVIAISERHSSDATIEVLDAGADDCLTKPFDTNELLARVRALIRRCSGCLDTLHRGALVINQRTRQAYLHEQLLELNMREYAILTMLARRSNDLVTRADILAEVWQRSSKPTSNLIDVYIRHLRSKLGDMAANLRTIRGQGYLLVVPEMADSHKTAPASLAAPA